MLSLLLNLCRDFRLFTREWAGDVFRGRFRTDKEVEAMVLSILKDLSAIFPENTPHKEVIDMRFLINNWVSPKLSIGIGSRHMTISKECLEQMKKNVEKLRRAHEKD